MYNIFPALSTHGLPALRAGRLDQTGSVKELKEFNYPDSQHAFVSRNQSACFACPPPPPSAAYTARTNATGKKGAAAKKKKKKLSKFSTDLWPLRDQRGCPVCIQGVQTDFKTALSLLQTPPAPICGQESHNSGAGASSITHSLAS